MTRRSAAPDIQPSLFDDFDPAPPPPPPPPPAKPRSNRRHVLRLPRPWPKDHYCDPTCLACGKPEEDGMCPGGCAIVCARPQPHRRDGKAPVEVCLVTTRTTARIVHGATAYDQPGRVLAVVNCPRCDRISWHPPAPARTYRQGTCGHPYIVTTQETHQP